MILNWTLVLNSNILINESFQADHWSVQNLEISQVYELRLKDAKILRLEILSIDSLQFFFSDLGEISRRTKLPLKLK